MKVVLLAGGYGTRISEETHVKPKPMVEIGDKPILWHIMKIYSRFGFNDFVICLGYKGVAIKEYFANYYLHESDITFDFTNGHHATVHQQRGESWKVTLVHTGKDAMTGARIRKIKPYVGNQPFMLTYGDGVADIDIGKLAEFHRQGAKLATITAVQPAGRFGMLQIDETNQVNGFLEKPRGDGGWINAGFFVLQPEVFDYLEEGEQCVFEQGPLEQLAAAGQLQAFRHAGFWHPMDTLRDKQYLDQLWESGRAPWKAGI